MMKVAHIQLDAYARVRKRLRLPDYEYSKPGAYFVTICTAHSLPVLGEIQDSKVVLSDLGKIAADGLLWLQEHFAGVVVDEWIVMPDHMHAVLFLGQAASPEGRSRAAPTPRSKPLGQLIGAYKTTTAKRANQLRGSPGAPFWQRGFFDHVIRNEQDLLRVREYIAQNPLKSELRTERERP